MNSTVIDDATAWNYYETLDSDPPEERIRKERELKVYAEAQQRTQYNDLRDFYTNPKSMDSLRKMPAIKEAMGISQTPDLVPIRALNRNFIAAQTGKLPEEIDDLQHDALMKAIASQRYGKETVTDQEFFGFVKGDYETDIRREDAVNNLYMQATAQALEDRLAGKETFFSPTFKAWADANRDLIDEEGETPYLTQAFTIYRQALWDIDRLKEPAAKGWDVLTKFTQGAATDQDVLDFAKTMADLPTEDRNQVYSYIATAAKARQIDMRTVDQIAKNFGESVSRSFDFVGKLDLNGQESAVRQMVAFLNDKGSEVKWQNLGDFARQQLASSERGRKALAGELAPEELEAFASELQSTLPVFQVARELKAVARDGVDPIRPVFTGPLSSSIERGFYGLAGSAGIMAVTLIHPALGGMAIYGEELDSIKLANPNIDPAAAAAIAGTSAAAQAAIEKLQVDNILGRLPVTGRFLQGMKPGLKKWAIATGLSVVEQNVQEGVQDLISEFVPALAASVREDMPEVDMEKLIGEWAGARGDVFFAVLPLALIGGGVATFRDFKDQGRFALSAKGLELAGFSKDQVIRINGAQDLDEAQAIYQEEFAKRTPENIKSGLEKAQQIIDSAERENNDPTLPKIESQTVNGKTEWIVSDADGRELYRTADEEAALLSYDEARQSTEDMQQSGVIALIDHLSTNAGTDFQVTPVKRMASEEIAAGEMSMAQLAEYVNIKGMEGDPSEMRVLGKTTVKELQDEGRRVIAEVFAGANPRTVVEEGVGVHLTKALDAGRITDEWLQSQIQAWDAANPNDTLLKTGTRQNLIEATTTLGKAYFAGKVKSRALGGGLSKFFRQLAVMFKQFFQRAARLKESFESGTLSPEFEALLADSLGFNAEQRMTQTEARAAADLVTGNSYSIVRENGNAKTMPDADQAGQTAQPASNETSQEADYRYDHQPRFDGALLSDLSENGKFVPQDIYQHPEWYGDVSSKSGRESWNAIRRARGNPDAKVTIYRAAPKGTRIETGNWVTLSRTYAEDHASVRDGNVVKKVVLASEVRWDGNDFNEFGYFPESPESRASEGGAPSYSIVTQAEIDRINATLEKLAKSPDSRIALFERAKNSLNALIDQHRQDIASLEQSIPNYRDPAEIAVEIEAIKQGLDERISTLESEKDAALENVEQERAAEIADIDIEREIALQEAGPLIVEQFADRIENAKTDATKKALEREAKARLSERRKAIRTELAEKKKATEERFARERQKVARETQIEKTKARDAAKKEEAKLRAEAKIDDAKIAGGRENARQKIRNEKLIQRIAELNAILRVFPPEIRGKVGGFATLTKIGTGDKAYADFIEKRAEMLDTELSRLMKREYTARLEKWFDKAKPPKGKPGEKPKGKLGADVHSLFAVLKDAVNWSATEVSAHVDALESQIASGELTPEQQAHAQMEAALVGLIGDWSNADPARQAAALANIEAVWMDGYGRYQAKKAAESERRKAVRETLRADTGTAGTKPERDERALKDNGLKGGWKDSLLGLLNFEQTAKWVFGDKSAEAQKLSDMERKASNAKEDAITAKMDAVEDLFTRLAGDRLKGEQLRWQMSQKAMTVKGEQLSELEAISATLMWRQEDGRRHMMGKLSETGKPVGEWHYNQDFIDEIERNLSPAAKVVRDFLASQYAAEYDQINPIYRELNGIDLPRNRNYSPLTVKPQQAQAGQMVDPVTGTTFSAGSTTPGSLRTRGNATAEPDFRDALQTFIAHTKQMEHWKAYAPFVSEAQAILGNRELGNSIEAAAGKEAVRVLRGWIDLLAQGGTRDAGNHLAINGMLTNVSNRAAAMALVGRVGTLAVQATQLGAALAEIPTGAYVVRMGKLFAGQLGWGEAFKSDYIQRRFKEMPPVVRQAVEGMRSEKPNILKHTVANLGRLIGGADALFTGGTYAIVYDYQIGQAKKMGLTGAEAEAYARNAAERSVDRVAQPTRAGTRSLFENTQTSPLARLGWAFASEARKNIVLISYAMAKRPLNEKARAVSYAWIINAAVGAVIRSAWKDARDDDDEEWFDDKSWSGKRAFLAFLTEPLYGFPAIGEALQGAVYSAAGEWHTSGNLFSSLERSMKPFSRVVDLLSGQNEYKDTEDVLRDTEAILTAMGLFSSNIAAAASLSHLARDLYGVSQNVTSDQ